MVSVGGGITLSYATQGDPHSPAIVLLHGYTDSWPSYRPLMAALSAGHRVIALSMRGHGESSKPASGYAISTFAADVIASMDELGIGEATIVGHSMGSLIAARVAMMYPERVTRLVLIGAFATLRGNSSVEALWRDDVAHLSDPVDPAFARAFQMASLAGPVDPAFIDAAVAESLRLPASVWRSVLRALLDDDHSNRLSEIRAPAVIIWGDCDAFGDRGQQDLLGRAIPDARLVVHAGVGHAPHWENPARVAADITAFLGSRSARAA
jgi:pimeloyl-ACP methyl ester carboxylesterase